MVCCDINQSQHGSFLNESYVGAGKSKQGFLNYSAGLREVIDLWVSLFVFLSIHISMCLG